MTEAWLMSEGDIVDQRAENRREPNCPVTLEELREIGVFTKKLDPSTMLLKTDGGLSEVDKLMADLGYKNRDEVCCAPGKLADYETKIKTFFREHIHEDEEIRLIADGSGYFDFRNAKDEWIRVSVTPGDFIIVPAGLYHRFTMDERDYTHAIRLFSDAPRWVPVDRPCEQNPYREAYVRDYITNPKPKQTLLGETGADNVLITLPSRFDATVRPLIQGLRPSHKDLLLLYFTGAKNPKTGLSWCPDCVEASPLVAQSLEIARSKRRVCYAECTVERGSYKNKADYLYRTHPFIQLRSIPTVIVCEGSDDDADDVGAKVLLKQESGSPEWATQLS